MDNSKLTFDEMFKAIEQAREQYDSYLKIGEELSTLQASDIEEEYQRDMNHPLGLVIKG